MNAVVARLWALVRILAKALCVSSATNCDTILSCENRFHEKSKLHPRQIATEMKIHDFGLGLANRSPNQARDTSRHRHRHISKLKNETYLSATLRDNIPSIYMPSPKSAPSAKPRATDCDTIALRTVPESYGHIGNIGSARRAVLYWNQRFTHLLLAVDRGNALDRSLSMSQEASTT